MKIASVFLFFSDTFVLQMNQAIQELNQIIIIQMKTVILAGGKGTRMGELSKTIPKPMLKIGNKPVLQHQVELLQFYGFHEIIIMVNHLRDTIIEYFGDGSAFGVKISYYVEEQPLGTVGGIKEIENQLTNDFLVLYGDVMINMHLKYFVDFHKKNNSDCTIVLHPNDHPFDSDLVELNNQNRITAFHPKPHEKGHYYRNLVNAGAYIFSQKIFNYIEKGRKADFGRDIFPAIYKKIRMFGYNTSEYLKDMGTIQRLQQVINDYNSGRIDKSNYQYPQKAVFLDRDGVINHEISFIHRHEDMKLYDFTPRSVKKINRSDYLAIAITNQSVVARNLCTIEELQVIHNKMETDLGAEGAKLDAIYFCPHHPDKGYPEENPVFKVECECRKPKPGMLLQAANDYHIDLAKSFMIGDSRRDIEAGKRAGCTTIGVRSGYGQKNADIAPDYMFDNLEQAVNFIVNEPYKRHILSIEKLIFTNLRESKSQPVIILVAGNSQSGKSTFAMNLYKHLKNNEIDVETISLDSWILPKTQRTDQMNVFERFRTKKMEVDLEQLLNGEAVVFKAYSPLRDNRQIEQQYYIASKQVVIIEGIVALSIETLRQKADMKIFMQVGEEEHRKRIYRFYRWKGYTDHEIAILYKKRKSDEYDLIEKDCTFADLVI